MIGWYLFIEISSSESPKWVDQNVTSCENTAHTTKKKHQVNIELLNMSYVCVNDIFMMASAFREEVETYLKEQKGADAIDDARKELLKGAGLTIIREIVQGDGRMNGVKGPEVWMNEQTAWMNELNKASSLVCLLEHTQNRSEEWWIDELEDLVCVIEYTDKYTDNRNQESRDSVIFGLAHRIHR